MHRAARDALRLCARCFEHGALRHIISIRTLHVPGRATDDHLESRVVLSLGSHPASHQPALHGPIEIPPIAIHACAGTFLKSTHGRVRYAVARTKPSGTRRLRPPRGFPACDQGRAGPPGRGRHVKDAPSPRAASQCASNRIKPHQTASNRLEQNMDSARITRRRNHPPGGLSLRRGGVFVCLITWVPHPSGGSWQRIGLPKPRKVFFGPCFVSQLKWCANPPKESSNQDRLSYRSSRKKASSSTQVPLPKHVVVLSIGRLYEHHMVPESVCDA